MAVGRIRWISLRHFAFHGCSSSFRPYIFNPSLRSLGDALLLSHGYAASPC